MGCCMGKGKKEPEENVQSSSEIDNCPSMSTPSANIEAEHFNTNSVTNPGVGEQPDHRMRAPSGAGATVTSSSSSRSRNGQVNRNERYYFIVRNKTVHMLTAHLSL